MKSTNPAVDAYIAKAAEYARPILKKLRALFHQACPEIQERLKWGVPSFEHKGIVGGMAAFKHHVSLGFWKTKLMKDPQGYFKETGTSMSALQFKERADLPADKILLAYIKEAVELNEKGVKLPAAKKKLQRQELVAPDFFLKALKKNKKALATFESFSYSHKKEYVEWLTEAKQEATRQRRLATALEWLAAGKARNWKYEKC